MGETIELRYMIPVIVAVDPEAKTVERVTVMDEDTSRSPLRGLLSNAERAALDIAEDADWPAWEFGR